MRSQVHGPYLRDGVPGQAVVLIVIGGATWQRGKHRPRRGRREPAVSLVTAVATDTGWVAPLSVGQILAWVWQRWEREGAHREMNAGVGVGQHQCWNTRSAVVSVPWRGWVAAVLVLAGYRTWGWIRGSTRPERWWRGAQRWRVTTRWRSERAARWGTAAWRSRRTTSTDDWLKQEHPIIALTNAALAAARAEGGPAACSPPKRPIHQHATERHQHLLPTLVIPPASTKKPNSRAGSQPALTGSQPGHHFRARALWSSRWKAR